MWVCTEILNISWIHFGVSAVAIRVVGIKAMEPFVHTTLLNNLKMTLSVYLPSAVQLFHQQLHDFAAHQYRVSKQLREIRFVRENCSLINWFFILHSQNIILRNMLMSYKQHIMEIVAKSLYTMVLLT